MNIFIKKIKNNLKPIKLKSVLDVNYGISRNSAKEIVFKNKLSKIIMNKNSYNLINKILTKNSLKFNRFLKLRNLKNIDTIKKQASWKGLRFRQGLPVNGQRTHTNARTAKKLVLGLSHSSTN